MEDLKKDTEKADKEVKSLKQKLGAAWRTGINGVKSQLKGMGKSADTADSKVSRLKKRLSGVWRITGGIILFNIIRKITRALEGLITVGLDFDKQMHNVASITGQAGKDFQFLTDAVIDLALDPAVTDGPAKLAEGLYEIISAGFNAADALVVLKAAAYAGTAGVTTTAVAADALTTVLKAYGLDASHATEVSNTLFAAVVVGKMTFEQLAGAIGNVIPTAAALGLGINEVTAAIAALTLKGLDADTAATYLNNILVAFLKPSQDMTDALLAHGYASGIDAIQTLGLTGSIDLLNQIIKEGSGNTADYVSDSRAMRAAMSLLADDASVYKDSLEQVNEAQDGVGATQKALTEQMKAASFQIAVLKKNIEILAVLGFGLLAPYLNKALTGINKFISSLIKYFRQARKHGLGVFAAFNQSLARILTEMFGPKTAQKILKWVKKAESAFYTIRDIILKIWPTIKKVLLFLLDHFNIIGPAVLGAVVAFKIFGVVMTVVNGILAITALIGAPALLIILAIIIIIAILAIAWYKDWGGIQEKTHTAIDFISGYLERLHKFFQPVIDGVQALGHYWKQVFEHDIEPGHLKDLPGWLRPIALMTGRVVKSLRIFIKAWEKAGALAAFRTLPAQIRAFGREMSKLLASAGLKHFAAAYKRTFYDAARLVGHIIDLIDDLVHGRWKKAWQDFLKIVQDYVRMMLHVFQGWGGLLLDIFNLIPWGKIASLLGNGLVYAVSFMLLTGIPWLAKAGLDLLGTLFSAMWGYFTGTIVPWLVGLGTQLVSYITTSDVFDLFYGAGNFIISGLWAGVQFAWDWGISWFKDLGSYLVSYFANPDKMLWQVGALLIMGLWNGIVWAWNWMIGQLEDMWNSLPNWAKKMWGILSPSKVFAEIGKEIPAGLAVGIEKGMHHVTRAMGGMNVAVSGGAPQSSRVSLGGGAGAMAASSVNNGGAITVNNNITSNQDPQVIADMVLRKTIRAIRRRKSGLP